MSKVILYSMRGCPTCDEARHGLTDKGIDFEERLVDDDPNWWDDIQKYSSSVPVIIWGEGDIEIGWQGQHG